MLHSIDTVKPRLFTLASIALFTLRGAVSIPAAIASSTQHGSTPTSDGAGSHRKGAELVGKPAPPFHLTHWLNSPSLEPADLKGKVLLVRWWTDSCPFCEATAPALRALDRKYRERGLVVAGIFHPKPSGDESLRRMRKAADRLGFDFPLALDAHWDALDRWWLKEHPRDWTSVSFIVDKRGVIRYVHPGGEYHEGPGIDDGADHAACRQAYLEIEKTIVRLLAE